MTAPSVGVPRDAPPDAIHFLRRDGRDFGHCTKRSTHRFVICAEDALVGIRPGTDNFFLPIGIYDRSYFLIGCEMRTGVKRWCTRGERRSKQIMKDRPGRTTRSFSVGGIVKVWTRRVWS